MPKAENITHNGKTFDIYMFSNPMFHEDWHTAEDMGLVYLHYDCSGNDYWDHTMDFVKKEDKELADDWLNTGWRY